MNAKQRRKEARRIERMKALAIPAPPPNEPVTKLDDPQRGFVAYMRRLFHGTQENR